MLSVYEHAATKELIAASLGEGVFLPLNQDLSISRRRLRRISDYADLKDSNVRLEVEIAKLSDGRTFRVLRRWNALRPPIKVSDPDAPLEQRIDVSPSTLFTQDERAYSGRSLGHPAAYILGIPVPIAALWLSGGTQAEVALIAFLLGAFLFLMTFKLGDPRRTREILDAKARITAAKHMNFRQAAQRIEWWRALSGVAFENAVAGVFCDWGFEVETTPSSSDGGIDLIARRLEKRILVQCKAYDGTVGVAAVRELIGARSQFPEAHEVWLVSLFGFTKGAKELARSCGIKLYSIADDYLQSSRSLA